MKKLTILPFNEAADCRSGVWHLPEKFFYTRSTYVNSSLLLLFLALIFYPFFFDLGSKAFCQITIRDQDRADLFTAPELTGRELAGEAKAQTIGEHGCCLLPDYETTLFELINGARREHNLLPYEQDRRLITFARIKGEDMLANGYIGHESLKLGRPGQQAAENGLCFSTYGENLAGNLKARDMQPELAFELLMESRYHREAILSANKSHLGIGVVKGPEKGVVFVMHFLSL